MSSFELQKQKYVCSGCGSTKTLVDSRDSINEYCENCRGVRPHRKL